MNNKSVNLQYNYAIIDQTGCCQAVVTSSYQVPLDTYIEIPSYHDDYVGKYYNPADGLFYYELEYINIFDPEA